MNKYMHGLYLHDNGAYALTYNASKEEIAVCGGKLSANGAITIEAEEWVMQRTITWNTKMQLWIVNSFLFSSETRSIDSRIMGVKMFRLEER